MTGIFETLFSREQMIARLSRAIMRVLRTDSLATARLNELAGRVIAVQVSGFGTTIYAAVDNGSLLLATQTAREPDVTLSGRIADFASFARARRTAQTVPVGRLQIQGDLATAQSIQQLLDDLEIDWEALLAEVVGDLAAHQLGRGVRHGLAWWRVARDAWAEDIPTYLQQERQWVPTAEEVEAHTREGMTLATEVELLAARVARLRVREPR